MALKGISGIGGGSRVFPPLQHTEIKSKINMRDILAYLRKPGDAVANVVDNASFGSSDTPFQSFVKGWQGTGTPPEKLADKILDAADIKNPSPTTKFLTRLSVSIGTDPITYVPLSLPFKALGKFIRSVPGVNKAIQGLKYSSTYQIPAAAIGKAFNPLHDTPKILQSMMQKHKYLTMGQSDAHVKMVRETIVKPYLKLPLPDRKLVTETMEQAAQGVSLDKALRLASVKLKASGIIVEPTKQIVDVLKKAQTIGKGIEKMEKLAGLDYERIKSMGYILHYIDPKYHSILHKLYPDTASFGMKFLLNAKHKDMLRRSTWYTDVPRGLLEAVEKLRPGTLKSMGLSRAKDLKLSESLLDSKSAGMLDEFMKAMKGIGKENELKLAQQGLKYKHKGWTVHEINQRAAEGKLELLYDPIRKEAIKIKDFMVEDVPTLLAIRGVRGARAIGQRQYVDEVISMARKSGLAYDDIKKVRDLGMRVERSDFVSKVLKKDIWFDREIANHLDKIETIMRSPQEFADLANSFDKVQNIWKWWTLVPIPSYHFRNAVGNTWNNVLAGVDVPKAYKIAAGAMSGKKGTIEGTNMTYQALRKEIAKWGVAGRGQIAIETSMKQLQSQLYGSTGAKIAAFGEFNENLARIANFVDGFVLKKMSANDARQRVAKFLFDYQELTPFERTSLRRVFPFYTWMRKNVPLQLEQFFKQTNKYTMFDRAMYAMEKDVPSPEFIPDMLKDRNPVFVGSEQDGTARAFVLSGYMPSHDIQQLLGGYGDTMLSMLTPLVKAPLEFFKNYSVFFNKSLEKYPGQRTNFMGANIPIKWANLVRNMRLFNEVDKLNPGLVFGSEDVPGVFGVTRGQRVEPEYTMRWMNFLTGLKFTPVEVDIMKKQYLQKLQNNILYIKGQETIAQRTGQDQNKKLAEDTRKKYEEQYRRLIGTPLFTR